MDLRLSGRSVPSLAALDTAGLVVHLFSFSKSLFPGARVGAISARGRVVDALARAQAGHRPVRLHAAAGRPGGVRRRRELRSPPAQAAPRAARAPRRAARGARAGDARRRALDAAGGRLPGVGRAAARASTRASCWPTRSAPACCSRRASSSITTGALRAACGSPSRWRTRSRCGAASKILAGVVRDRLDERAAQNGARSHLIPQPNGEGPTWSNTTTNKRRRERQRRRPHDGDELRDQGRPGRDAEGRRDHGRHATPIRRRSPRMPARRR